MSEREAASRNRGPRVTPAEAISHSARDLRLKDKIQGNVFQLLEDTIKSFLECKTDDGPPQQAVARGEGESALPRAADKAPNRASSVPFMQAPPMKKHAQKKTATKNNQHEKVVLLESTSPSAGDLNLCLFATTCCCGFRMLSASR
jgi:hypothetical protein